MKMKLKHVFFVMALLALLLVPHAVALEVSSSIAITGNGTVDHETEINTHPGMTDGLKYEEGFYTKSLGYYDISTINFTSDFSMIASDKLNTTLTVEGLLEATNVKQKACLRHFDLKARQSFWVHNDTEVVYMFEANNCSASFDLAQELSGAGGYRLLVLNSTNNHIKEYIDTARYLGDYELLISNFVGCSTYPAAGEEEDWLICPSSVPTWHYETMEP